MQKYSPKRVMLKTDFQQESQLPTLEEGIKEYLKSQNGSCLVNLGPSYMLPDIYNIRGNSVAVALHRLVAVGTDEDLIEYMVVGATSEGIKTKLKEITQIKPMCFYVHKMLRDVNEYLKSEKHSFTMNFDSSFNEPAIYHINGNTVVVASYVLEAGNLGSAIEDGFVSVRIVGEKAYAISEGLTKRFQGLKKDMEVWN